MLTKIKDLIKKPIIWIPAIVVFCSLVIVLCILLIPKKPSSPPDSNPPSASAQDANGEYLPTALIGISQDLSSANTSVLSSQYCIRDGYLYDNTGIMYGQADPWKKWGALIEFKLTKDNFDAMLHRVFFMFSNTYSTEYFQLHLKNAWYVAPPTNTFGPANFYILQLTTGELFLFYNTWHDTSYILKLSPSSSATPPDSLIPSDIVSYKSATSSDGYPALLFLSLKTKSFQLIYSSFSPALQGEYHQTEDTLSLTTTSKKENLIFHTTDGILIFDADISSSIPSITHHEKETSVSPLPDGTAFSNGFLEHPLTYGRVYRDLNGDGVTELYDINITVSSRTTFTVTVFNQQGTEKLFTATYPIQKPLDSVAFVDSEDGNLMIRQYHRLNQQAGVLYEVNFTDGKVTLHQDGQELAVITKE